MDNIFIQCEKCKNLINTRFIYIDDSEVKHQEVEDLFGNKSEDTWAEVKCPMCQNMLYIEEHIMHCCMHCEPDDF